MLKKKLIFYSLIFVCLVLSVFWVEPSLEGERFRIIFESNRDGNGEIYMMDSNGKNLMNLTNSPTWEEGFPSCSPDGSKIIFNSCRIIFDNQGLKRYEYAGIYMMDADGSNPKLVNNSGGFARWSPDVRKIVYTSEGPAPGDIYVINADGSNLKNLTNHPAHDCSPSWSPDGSKIAFHSNRDGNFDIYVMNVDGSNVMNITEHPANDFWPIWSPDGSKIAFDSNRDGNIEIYVMDANGSNLKRLTNNPADDRVSDWAPDGRKIVFDSERDWWKKQRRWRDRRKLKGMSYQSMREIYVMDADGRNQTRLTNNRTMDRRPSCLRIVGQLVTPADGSVAPFGESSH